MKKTKTYQIIQYFSLIFILSYFLTHNIFLVLTGITFSLYLINIDMINNLKRLIIKNLSKKKEYKESVKNVKEINCNIIDTKSIKEDNKLTLVEEIEELGFIPSIIKKDKKNAA